MKSVLVVPLHRTQGALMWTGPSRTTPIPITLPMEKNQQALGSRHRSKYQFVLRATDPRRSGLLRNGHYPRPRWQARKLKPAHNTMLPPRRHSSQWARQMSLTTLQAAVQSRQTRISIGFSTKRDGLLSQRTTRSFACGTSLCASYSEASRPGGLMAAA